MIDVITSHGGAYYFKFHYIARFLALDFKNICVISWHTAAADTPNMDLPGDLEITNYLTSKTKWWLIRCVLLERPYAHARSFSCEQFSIHHFKKNSQWIYYNLLKQYNMQTSKWVWFIYLFLKAVSFIPVLYSAAGKEKLRDITGINSFKPHLHFLSNLIMGNCLRSDFRVCLLISFLQTLSSRKLLLFAPTACPHL